MSNYTAKRYSPEFKQRIVKLYETGNYSMTALGREYDVTTSTVSKWINAKKPIMLDDGTQTNQTEIQILQKENARLKEDLAILKLAAVLLGQK